MKFEAVAGFDWDAANTRKCLTHGVSVAEIEALLKGEPAVAPDPKHGGDEQRLIAVGRNPAGRPMFVALPFASKKEGA
jgi:uncharacterized protein